MLNFIFDFKCWDAILKNLRLYLLFSFVLKKLKKEFLIKKIVYNIVFLFSVGFLNSQISIPNTSTITENFNSMNATTTTPTNWKMQQSASPTYAGGTTSLGFQASSGTPATGGTYNWGTTGGVDRALGVMTSGGYNSPNSVMGFYRNTNTSTLTQLAVTYNLERYRINTAAASVQFYYSTNGSSWTAVSAGDIASGTIGSGASAYNFSPQATFPVTFSISGLSVITNGDIYLRWNLNTTGSNSQGIGIDDVSVTATFAVCVPPAAPTTLASSINSTPSCSSNSITFNAGNGSNRLIVMNTSNSFTNPTSNVSYTANTVYGSGSIIGAGNYVVYNGSGNSVTVTGLNPNTTYYFKIFEYNGTSTCNTYLTAGVNSSTFTTTICVTRPHLTGVLINSCENGCNEGDNEIVFGRSANYSILANTANVVLKYDPPPTAPPASTIYTTLVNNAATTTALNTAAGCPGLFIDGNGATIPPQANFMIVRNTICPSAYNWSSLCGNGPIYVLYTNHANWIVGGNFTNSASGLRYFRTTITTTDANVNTIDYSFDSNSLTSHSNGDYITFSSSGGAATNYLNNGCTLDPIILPIDWNYFNVESKNNTVHLNWSTYSERNNDYFDIEMADEQGKDFIFMGRVKGNGTTSSIHEYQHDVTNLEKGNYYFRIKQVDFDGNFAYSAIRSVKVSGSDLEILKINNDFNSATILFDNDIHKGSIINIYEITGKKVYFKEMNESLKSITIDQPLKGMLIFKIEHPTKGNETLKVILE